MASLRSLLPGRGAVSVVMATYNGERHLPEMLETLAAQTRPPDELVVRDDASQDGTVAILQAFARRAPFRVEVVAGGPRLGFAQNFVAAAGAAAGQVLCFADQDDTWRPEKLATIAPLVRRRTPVAVFHDFALQADDGAEVAPSVFALLAERGFGPTVAVNGCSMAVNRAFVDLWGWPPADPPVSHDVWVALLSTAFGQRQIVDDVLVDWRLHEGNASGWVASASSRKFVEPTAATTDLEVMVDVLIKKKKAPTWTGAFLEVLRERGRDVDPAASERLAEVLRTNRRRHRTHRRSPA
ncbi:MAG TPA: glycosyltransferase [Nocardioides sp.]|nr:glycosyltransferase [Nocardioides sp.]